MSYKASYLVDLSGLALDDSTESTEVWIQAMPLGVYEHPKFGTIDVTPERVQRYAENVKNNVRTTQLDIDYDHKQYGGDAAGWVKDAENRGADGLWLLVDWTKKAYQSIKDKAYRYFSAEYDDQWTHPKSGVVYQDVIYGGALTNRPFLKDIMPINLSEVFANVTTVPTKSDEGGSTMKPEQVKSLAVKLGLSENATEEDVLAGLESFSFAPPAAPTVVPDATAALAALEEAKKLQALEAAKKLGESNPAIATIMSLYTAQAELVEQQGQQLSSFSAKLKEEQVEKTVKALTDKAKGKGYAIPPVMASNLTETLLSLNDESLSKTILDGFNRIVESQIVALGERGYLSRKANEDGQSATEEFTSEVKKLTDSDKGLSFADAADLVAKRNPDLYHKYQEDSYAFGGDN